MLGKKKKDKKEDDLPEFEQGETADAKIELESKQQMIDFVANEFQEQYAGIFDPKAVDEEKINIEAMSLDLLFAIFAELRLQRLIMQQKKP